MIRTGELIRNFEKIFLQLPRSSFVGVASFYPSESPVLKQRIISLPRFGLNTRNGITKAPTVDLWDWRPNTLRGTKTMFLPPKYTKSAPVFSWEPPSQPRSQP